MGKKLKKFQKKPLFSVSLLSLPLSLPLRKTIEQFPQVHKVASSLAVPVVDVQSALVPEQSLKTIPQEEVVQALPLFPWRKIIRFLIYAAVFLIPLWFLPFTQDFLDFNKQMLLIVLVGGGLILAVLEMLITKRGCFQVTPRGWLMGGIVITVSLVLLFLSDNRSMTLFGTADSRSITLVSGAFLGGLYWLAKNMIDDRGKTLFQLLIFSLVLVLLVGVLQIFGWMILPEKLAAKPTFNTVGTLNSLGLLAALILPLFAGTVLITNQINQTSSPASFKGKRWLRIVALVGLGLSLMILVLANWWVLWLLALISLVILAIFRLMSLPSLPRLKNQVGLGIIILLVLLLATSLSLFPVSKWPWHELVKKFPQEVSLTQRGSWQIAWQAIKQRPLGYGLENFSVVYDQFKPQSSARTVFAQVRFVDSASEITNLVVEGGISLILLLWLGLLIYGRRLMRQLKKSFLGNSEAQATWATSLGIIISFFFYPLNLTILMVLTSLLILNTIQTLERKETVLDSTKRQSVFKRSMVLVGSNLLLLLIAMSGYLAFGHYRANWYLAEALASSDRSVATQYLLKSNSIYSQEARSWRLLSQVALVQLADHLRIKIKNEEKDKNYWKRAQELVTLAISSGVRSTTVESADAQNWANRGFIYQNLIGLVDGSDRAAIEMYQESLKRNPADALTFFRLGNVYLSQVDYLQNMIQNSLRQKGKPDLADRQKQLNQYLRDAEVNFQKATNLLPNFSSAFHNLAVIYLQQGRVPEAIVQIKKVVEIDPTDLTMQKQLKELEETLHP